LKASIALAALAAISLTSSAVAQAVSSDVVVLGTFGSKGCQNADNPPTLSDGSPATADLGYSFDRTTGRLTLTVSNTTPVTPGVQNPLITAVYFNLPDLAITSATLLSQTAAGGATPNFGLTLDLNTTANPSPNSVGCFGSFGAKLSKSGGGIQGGIANPLADNPAGPTAATVIGPVVFVIQFNGPGVGNLTAQAFSRVLSYKSNGQAANAAAKFQGGAAGGSGFIGNAFDCSAAGWVLGDPVLGGTLTIVMEGAPGCYGCFVISLDPGPAIFDGILMPVGFPWLALNSQAFLAPGDRFEQNFFIPNDPAFANLTIYGAVGLADAATQSIFSVTQQIVITIRAN
jgi:hypothetical protein